MTTARFWQSATSNPLFDITAPDEIDLAEIQAASTLDAAARRVGRVAAIADRVRSELDAYYLRGFRRDAAE